VPRVPRTSNELSVQAVFQRALALPQAGKLELYKLLGEWLQEAGAAPSKTDLRVQRQHEVLEAMAAVAHTLALPEGKAPTTTQFNATCRTLGLRWNVSSAGRAFNGWRNATDAFAGRHLPETSRQIRMRRYLSGARRSPRAHLQSVRDWLATSPTAETIEDYERWRTQHNDALAGTDDALAADWISLRRVLPGLRGEGIIEAAKLNITDTEAFCRERAQERLAAEENPAELVSIGDTAALLGLTESTVRRLSTTDASFPNIVISIGRSALLYLPDVRAYGAQASPPSLAAGALERKLVGANELATEFGLQKSNLWGFINGHQDWRIPMPDGRTSGIYYWLREKVETWKALHPPETRKRRPIGHAKGRTRPDKAE